MATARLKQSRRCRRPRGFTLMELLIVIMLLGVLAFVILSNLSGTASAENLRESAGRMEALVSMCRAQAMNESRTYQMRIRQDGSVQVRAQRDAILAPQEFIEVPHAWARMDFTLDTVWVDRVQRMPDGPAPVLVEDDVIEFTNLDTQPEPVADFDEPIVLDFAPDGSASSLRWILRDVSGHGMQQTYDGRLGRIATESVESLLPGDLQKPEPLPPEEPEDSGIHKAEVVK